MKRLLLLSAFTLCITAASAKDIGTTVTQLSQGSTVYNVSRARSVLFILNVSGTGGTVQLETQPGSGSYLPVTSGEVNSLLLEAPAGDTLNFNYRVATAQIRVVLTQ